jgi:excisionase family DNA binding protein
MASDNNKRAHSSSPERIAYRPSELAAMVGLSAKAIYRAIDRGELGAAKVANGSRLLIPKEAAENWLLANSVLPAERSLARRSSRRRRPLAQALSRADAYD